MAVEYQLSFPQPHSHLIGVEIRIPAASSPIELVMPSWTPGSYLIREFPRNVQDFAVQDSADLPLAWRKIDKNTWRIEANPAGPVTVRYRAYANELTVRTSHVDASHAYVNGASVFMFVRRLEGEEARVRIDAPEGWRVATSLRETDDGWLIAVDYDELVDSPIEVGRHRTIVWEQAGVDHRFAIWGAAEIDEQRLVSDTRRVIETCSALFGGLPYDRYLFILHVFPDGRGGLEHRYSSSLHVPPSWLAGEEYEKLIALIAHEFFHVWLGKRIRPLGPFDYVAENYTRNLWVVEGFTTYYTELILLRAGLMTRERFLARLGASIAQLESLPGRKHQSLEESSFDAWIKFYRPDPHTPNSQVSYYHKGSLVALALDLELRRATGGERSLDDVMRLLWERYGARDVGFPEDRETGIQAVVSEVAGGASSVVDLFATYVASTDEIDFDTHLEAAGLELVPGDPGDGPGAGPRLPLPAPHEVRLGVRIREDGGRMRVTHVLEGTPAFHAGVNTGDEIVAVNGARATTAELARVTAAAGTGDDVELMVVRRERVEAFRVVLGESAGRRARITGVVDATEGQAAVRKGWLGG